MISVTNLRAGAYFTEDNNLFQVLNYEFVKLGRGTATIKTKIKNLRSGSIVEKVFISGAKVQEANLDKKESQYLYKNGNNFVFMDPNTFEQFELSNDKIGDQASYLKEGMNIKVVFYQDEPLTIELPIKMEFTIAETEPGYRGNSATNIFKDAVLDNKVKVRVPLFVEIGDMVLIDTRTGEYVQRINK
ncbi:MAG: elongation factor P [Candidatus Gottesmanbacteria bacterium]